MESATGLEERIDSNGGRRRKERLEPRKEEGGREAVVLSIRKTIRSLMVIQTTDHER